MAVDNTHTKYLHGADKKAWKNYKKAYDAQNNLESFLGGLTNGLNLKEGEEYEVPVKKGAKK